MIKNLSKSLYSICPLLDDFWFNVLTKQISAGTVVINSPQDINSSNYADVSMPSGYIKIVSDKYDVSEVLNDLIAFYIKAIFKKNVYMEKGLGITVYQKNEGLPLHWDGATENLMTPSGNPTRDISAVFYPESFFIGGNIHFPNLDLKIKPEHNMLLIFPSTELYAHRVEKVIEGTRYMCSSFWCVKE